jgi:hypothetical protein
MGRHKQMSTDGGARQGYRFASMKDIKAYLANEVLHYPGFFEGEGGTFEMEEL